MNLDEQLARLNANEIKTRQDFVEFLESLEHDFTVNGVEWENNTIDGYLESIRAWLNDYSRKHSNEAKWESPDWSLVASLFYVGKIYE